MTPQEKLDLFRKMDFLQATRGIYALACRQPHTEHFVLVSARSPESMVDANKDAAEYLQAQERES